jgi:hypothetical protein
MVGDLDRATRRAGARLFVGQRRDAIQRVATELLYTGRELVSRAAALCNVNEFA